MKKFLLIALLLPLGLSAQNFSNFWGLNPHHCDTVAFDDTTALLWAKDTAAGNLWQIGNPAKAVFTGALSGSRSLVTDTANTYPAGNTSSFVIKWLDQLQSVPNCYDNSLALFFVHSMNTDSMAGGYIEFSDDSVNWENVFDASQAWYNLGVNKVSNFNFTSPMTNVLPFTPDTINGHLGFSGNFTADTFFIYQNPYLLRAFFNPMLRFTFISGGNAAAHDGWMIDDLVFSSYQVLGSVDETLSKSITVYPNPADDKIAFDFQEQSFKPVKYNITNMLGQQVAVGEYAGKPINVAALVQGTYFVMLTDSKGTSATKLFYKQ